MKGYSEHVCACTCGTHSLEALEEAVEEEVPDDFAILKGRNVPYEEVGNHSQRGWQYDPADEIKQEEGGGRDGSGTGKHDNSNSVSRCKTWSIQSVEHLIL